VLDFLTEWLQGGKSWLPCPAYKQKSLLYAYDFTIGQDYTWALSSLGLTFWNWPGEFNASFIMELEREPDHPSKWCTESMTA
jgi:hypothetical protein